MAATTGRCSESGRSDRRKMAVDESVMALNIASYDLKNTIFVLDERGAHSIVRLLQVLIGKSDNCGNCIRCSWL